MVGGCEAKVVKEIAEVFRMTGVYRIVQHCPPVIIFSVWVGAVR